jgi:hypothetical protein
VSIISQPSPITVDIPQTARSIHSMATRRISGIMMIITPSLFAISKSLVRSRYGAFVECSVSTVSPWGNQRDCMSVDMRMSPDLLQTHDQNGTHRQEYAVFCWPRRPLGRVGLCGGKLGKAGTSRGYRLRFLPLTLAECNSVDVPSRGGALPDFSSSTYGMKVIEHVPSLQIEFSSAVHFVLT